MSRVERLPLINEIEHIRGSKVVCYLTSTRQNSSAQMGEDAVRVFFDHLLVLEQRPIEQIDIFLCSNGGNGVVPWRLISLLREFAKKIGVLIPYRAYSAATMLALGADEIVMHPFAEMGPIDPTVSNDYNPIDEQTRQRVGISVEDVKAYIGFIKETVGIRHDDELIKAVEILANKVHPLALGNVERFVAQSRMIARKILLTHMTEDKSRHEIDETIETLASKLYFHGHPINRKEAKEELRLKVVYPDLRLEAAMWELYVDFEKELLNREPFDPMAKIYGQVVKEVQSGQAAGTPIVPAGFQIIEEAPLAIVESVARSTSFETKRRFVVVGAGAQLEPIVRAETLSQGWKETPDSIPVPSRGTPTPPQVPKGRKKQKVPQGAP